MRESIRKQLPDFAALLAIFTVALLVGVYLVAHQRLNPPSWVPFIGQSSFMLKAKFTTAAGVMPGQGQQVTISGVKVGEVASVGLSNGNAVVSMRIEPHFAHIRPDAHLLLRPKTGLKDMIVEMDPGTNSAGPELKSGTTLGTNSTDPDVNFDEFLATLDGDTRDYLKLLVTDAGIALGHGNGRALANTLRRFEPLSRDGAKATELVISRRQRLRRLISNLSKIGVELGNNQQQLAQFVQGSAGVFRRFANQNQSLGSTLRLLPGALQASHQALGKLNQLALTLHSATRRLDPSAKALGPALKQLRPFFKRTAPVLKSQLRLFAREAQPTARQLVPVAHQFAKATPDLSTLAKLLNNILNELAYKPPGSGFNAQSYLFYVPWANHNTNSTLANQDGIGPTRRGLVLFPCGALALLDSLGNPAGKNFNPTLTTLIQLVNAPHRAEVCSAAEAGQ